MPTLTIKNMPDTLYRSLKTSASENHRSLNGEAIVRLKHALSRRDVDVERVIAEADKLRRRTGMAPVTDAEFNRAKRRGRA